MKFRCLQDHDCKEFGHEKYDAEGGYSTRMYGVLSFGIDSPFIAVCEGELDALVATECAGIPAVALPGVNAWKPHYQYMFEGYSDVIALVDGDDAGRKLGDKVTNALDNARMVVMPNGLDVNSFVQQHSAQALRQRAGIDVSE